MSTNTERLGALRLGEPQQWLDPRPCPLSGEDAHGRFEGPGLGSGALPGDDRVVPPYALRGDHADTAATPALRGRLARAAVRRRGKGVKP